MIAGICFVQYQNKWGSQLGKEYIQRTGGWEHLWIEVANKMGENQIGAGRNTQSFPGVSCQKHRLGTFLHFFVHIEPWILGRENFLRKGTHHTLGRLNPFETRESRERLTMDLRSTQSEIQCFTQRSDFRNIYSVMFCNSYSLDQT